MQTISVIGSSGQLASELKLLKDQYAQFTFHFIGQDIADISKIEEIEPHIELHKPDFIINCAAYTAVDKAESDQERAYAINEKGAKNLAELAKKNNSYLIHISTDFVFDGKKSSPYNEEDPTAPLSIYGQSKIKGEEMIRQSGCNFTIIRTSWLYSQFGNNFLKTMLRLGSEREQIHVVSDQIGTPTHCADLAEFILSHLLSLPKHKNTIFHFSNEGVASWYDFAYEIMQMKKLPCSVVPIATAEYPTPAHRPSYSLMNKAKIKQTFHHTIPHWKESLRRCIQLLPQ